MKATQESWRAVVGFEHAYAVSDQGRVRSIDRYVRSGWGVRFVAGRELPINKSDAYPRVSIAASPTRVHQLVATAFLGPRPEGMYICHNNGNGDDNRLANLRYDTPSGNVLDAVRHGTHSQASKTRCKNGHPYTPENTVIHGEGPRRCRICRRASDLRAKAKYRLKRSA